MSKILTTVLSRCRSTMFRGDFCLHQWTCTNVAPLSRALCFQSEHWYRNMKPGANETWCDHWGMVKDQDSFSPCTTKRSKTGKHMQTLEDVDGEDRTETLQYIKLGKSRAGWLEQSTPFCHEAVIGHSLGWLWTHLKFNALTLNTNVKKSQKPNNNNTQTHSGIHKNNFWRGRHLDKQTKDVATNQQ